ncbi:hypothetical protein EYF80_067550 [Liparis tanakae]|uniref:Uncharacterized protein n=1 Tax=Liparis tanakae TaxID=230148 RepID=A0A4Z2E0J8_9TELE|nr:hypothetical protein EYF80_067550 [Liparis tanakae]
MAAAQRQLAARRPGGRGEPRPAARRVPERGRLHGVSTNEAGCTACP